MKLLLLVSSTLVGNETTNMKTIKEVILIGQGNLLDLPDERILPWRYRYLVVPFTEIRYIRGGTVVFVFRAEAG